MMIMDNTSEWLKQECVSMGIDDTATTPAFGTVELDELSRKRSMGPPPIVKRTAVADPESIRKYIHSRKNTVLRIISSCRVRFIENPPEDLGPTAFNGMELGEFGYLKEVKGGGPPEFNICYHGVPLTNTFYGLRARFKMKIANYALAKMIYDQLESELDPRYLSHKNG